MSLVPPGLQVGFGDLIDPVWLKRVADAGIVHARISGVTPGPRFELRSADQCAEMAQQIIDHGMQPLLTVRAASQVETVHDGTLIEYWNESDITSNGWHWQSGLQEMWKLIAVCDARKLKLYVGGSVSGLHKRGFDHLKQYPWREIPDQVGVSIHRYPSKHNPQAITPYGGWNPFAKKPRSRFEEYAWLRNIIGSRVLAVSEFGYASVEFTPEEQMAAFRFERQYWSDKAEVLIAYQMIDGGTDREGTYGGWTASGIQKPWVEAFVHV